MIDHDNNDIRYRGHLSLCEIDRPGQERLGASRVLIVGAGGLGSPVALYLAAAGVGNITILDPDKVSLSNLQRQVIHTTADINRLKVESAATKMTAINPGIAVVPLCEPLTASNASIFVGMNDIVVDCTDNLETRMLINDTCLAMDKPYVFGAVRRWGGQVFTHVPGSASYLDFFDATPTDELPCAIDGVLNTVVGVIGCLQATEVIKWAVGTGDLLVNRLLTFDAIDMSFNTFSV